MRDLINLVEESEMSFKDSVRGSHSGQMDMTLTCYVGKNPVGHIDYSVYRDEPHVQMIFVSVKRKGYGKALLQQLQRMFSDIEIDLGYLTGQGKALIDSLDFEIIENPRVMDLENRLSEINAKLQDYSKKAEQLKNHSASDREKIIASMSDWNDLTDEKDEIEYKLHDMKPVKRLIKID